MLNIAIYFEWSTPVPLRNYANATLIVRATYILRETLGFSVLRCFSCGISVIFPLRFGILFYPFKQFRYSLNFRRGTAVFHDFSPGYRGSEYPPMSPSILLSHPQLSEIQ